MSNGIELPQNLICGYFDCSVFGDMKVSPQRVRTLYEIEYYLEDGKFTYSDGVAYPIKKDHIKIGLPGEVCNSMLPFRTKYIKFNADGIIAERLRNMPKYFCVSQKKEICELLDRIILLSSEKKSDELMIYGLLFEFVSLVLEDAKMQDAISNDIGAVTQAKKYMDENFSKPIKLQDIAAHVNLSPNYFHSLFSDAVGKTPLAYLTDRRIFAVRELLCTTSLTLLEISERCGFCNQQYMSSLFKKKNGLTPAKFKKEYQKDYLI